MRIKSPFCLNGHDKRITGLHHLNCRQCVLDRHKTPEDKLRRRNQNLKKHYGITLTEYNQLLEKQNYRCAICKTDKPRGKDNQFHVDHDHLTNKIRGLLCGSCNVALGLFHENETVLKLAIDYLQH